VCERWRESFLNFLADMGERPGKKFSLDRVDNNGPYTKSNCRWATQTEQTRNTRNNRLLEFNGVTRCLADWAHLTGVPDYLIYRRLSRGWPPVKALDPNPGRRDVLVYEGREYTLKALAEKFDLKPVDLRYRLNKGVPLPDALNMPSCKHGFRLKVTQGV